MIMANKDKFKKMQQGGGFSFEDMIKQATTVAAIEQQVEQPKESVSPSVPVHPRYTPDTPR